MQDQNIDKIIFQITVKDLQNVARDVLGRYLTDEEVKPLENSLGDYIDWYNALSSAIIKTVYE